MMSAALYLLYLKKFEQEEVTIHDGTDIKVLRKERFNLLNCVQLTMSKSRFLPESFIFGKNQVTWNFEVRNKGLLAIGFLPESFFYVCVGNMRNLGLHRSLPNVSRLYGPGDGIER